MWGLLRFLLIPKAVVHLWVRVWPNPLLVVEINGPVVNLYLSTLLLRDAPVMVVITIAAVAHALIFGWVLREVA